MVCEYLIDNLCGLVSGTNPPLKEAFISQYCKDDRGLYKGCPMHKEKKKREELSIKLSPVESMINE